MKRLSVSHQHTHLGGDDTENCTEQDAGGRGQEEVLHCCRQVGSGRIMISYLLRDNVAS